MILGGVLVSPAGAAVTIGAEPITIGRDASADLCIDDPLVSALHCELRATPKGVLVRDLESTNGTLVGPLAVAEATIVEACTLRLGNTRLELSPAKSKSLDIPRDEATSFGPLVGGSAVMRRLYQQLEKIARTELSVLVTGETGTGKELAARAIHDHSARAAGPFVVIDCSALAPTLAESTLFGHERGAFTGAVARSEGALRSARGGTVFLDELGELPDDLQPKLLRAIAERTVKPVGGSKYESVDLRVVAATRRDLRKAMNTHAFREDLFFRIAQVRIELPPLRSRVDDIPEIVAEACRRIGRPDTEGRVASYIRDRFARYDWPGNVRELVNVASVLSALGDAGPEDLLPLEGAGEVGEIAPDDALGFVLAKRRFEEAYFRRLLEAAEGNVSEVARRCGLARHQVRAHLKKLGLSR